jgi:hypothetical protein
MENVLSRITIDPTIASCNQAMLQLIFAVEASTTNRFTERHRTPVMMIA